MLLGIYNFLLDSTTNEDRTSEWKQQILDFLKEYLVPITIFLLILTAVFSVVLTFLIMKTENPETQAKYKKRMVQLLVTIVICLLLVWVLYWLLQTKDWNGFIDGVSKSVQFPSNTSSGS